MTGVEQQFSKLEGEAREFVQRDSASLHRTERDETDNAAEPRAENLDVLIRRVGGASAEEIDRVILELQGVRDMLRGEGERVSREIMNYERLSETAISAMKVVNDSLNQWKDGLSNRVPATAAMPSDHAS
jgi:hypothetical protein